MLLFWCPTYGPLTSITWSDSNCGHIMYPWRLLISELDNAPLQAISILCQMEDMPVQGVQVSHLWSPGGCLIWPRAPGLTSMMARGDSNCGCIMGSWCLLISELNNGPFPGHSSLWSDGRYACSSVPFMVFWWVQHLAKGPRLDFNNGPRG